ncbi:MAG: aromatic acid decarboxylase [Betaproteobacteria bacterium HGW-Betaproteobacteria-10]|nr:MAG: aromatic acid decarboxylase [Betaproteobacteria bacterium HGW-Betaproteobacteria-10]
MSKTICLALTGASGMPYGLRLLECLLNAGCNVQLLYSQASQIVAKQEMDFELPSRPAEAKTALLERFPATTGSTAGPRVNPEKLTVFGREEWFAPVASGSNPPDAMVICPCSMGTLAAIAQGLADKLIERAADVVLKEGRKLILVPRETPFSAIHLENMLRLSRAGAVILPPNPGFYHHPKNVQDIIDFVVARILDQINVPHTLIQRWGE